MTNDGRLWLELLGNKRDFEDIVISSVNEAFNAATQKAAPSIQRSLQDVVYSGIDKCPELQDLRSGSLRGELGLTSRNAGQASDNIARAVSKSVVVELGTASAKKGIGGLDIYVQPSDFANVLGIGGSSVTYFSKRYKRPITLEWLDWLLKEGDRIIVGKFRFEPTGGRGRSSLGNMKKGGTWRVSPRYAGTKDNNFITRALSTESLQNRMSNVIQTAIEENWR